MDRWIKLSLKTQIIFVKLYIVWTGISDIYGKSEYEKQSENAMQHKNRVIHLNVTQNYTQYTSHHAKNSHKTLKIKQTK